MGARAETGRSGTFEGLYIMHKKANGLESHYVTEFIYLPFLVENYICDYLRLCLTCQLLSM